MNDRLDEIKARLKAATPGPWILKRVRECGDDLWLDTLCSAKTKEQGDNDVALLAHAPSDLAYLLSALESAEKVVEAARLAMFEPGYGRVDGENSRLMDAIKEYDAVADAKLKGKEEK